jgi:hypothetical protein
VSPRVVIGFIRTLAGKSAVTRERNVGEAAGPDTDGPASTVLAVCVFSVSVIVPEVVMGDPDIVYNTSDAPAPVANATEVTVPVP